MFDIMQVHLYSISVNLYFVSVDYFIIGKKISLNKSELMAKVI